ncbi:hypothetical protein OAD49_00460 [Flavobacteriaceae bacterium]|nr:hypothetical protein [Flavobacteriaceae bacterium]
MLDAFWTYLQFGKHFCGVELSTQNQTEILNATVLLQSKKELNISASFKENSVEGLSKKLPKNQHIVLIVNNEKVLSKTIENKQTDALKLVYSAFPNINLDDFYFEVLSQKGTHFINICRKDYIKTLVDTYAKHHLLILNISLGNHSLSNLVDFLNEKIIYSSNAKITLENNDILQIEKGSVASESYDINGSRVTNDQLPSFSGALQPILKNNATNTNFSTEKKRLVDSYKQTRFFNLFIKFGGLFILGLLLINFLFFNHHFDTVNELEQVSEINQSTKTQIHILNETVSKKQKMIDDLLKNNGSKSSFYSHTIIESLPKTILLSDYHYQPLLRRIKEDTPIELSEDYILVSGSSIGSADFSEWINHLEKIEWIAKVSIIEYRNTNSKKSEFKISILIRNE